MWLEWNGCKANLARVVRNGNVETMTVRQTCWGDDFGKSKEGRCLPSREYSKCKDSSTGGLGYIHCDCDIVEKG